MQNPFDGLLAAAEAAQRWGLDESTIRNAVRIGKLVDGTDVRKFGKQWIVTDDAMHREYGDPDARKRKKSPEV